MNNRRTQKRKANVKAIRIGFRLGLLLFTAYLTVKIAILGLQIAEARTGAPGGEILILPMIALLLWAGWTARKEYDQAKKGGIEHEPRQSLHPRSEK